MENIILTMLCASFLLLIVLTLAVISHPPAAKKAPAVTKIYPQVSILKPVTGIVDDMESSLESFFNLDYDDYEIIFGVTAISDPYVKTINMLRQKYRNIRTKVIEAGVSPLQNPKIHTLSKLEKHSTGQLYWIVDSNIKVDSGVLKSMVNEYIQHGSKMVFSPICGIGSGTFASIIENGNLNFFVSGGMVFGWSIFKKQIITGKSTLIEKEALDLFEGFAHFKNYLAEDFIMGEAFTDRKFKISSNYVWVYSVNSTTTLVRLFKRLARWAKLRFHLKWYVYISEILFNPVMIALSGAVFIGGIWNKILIFAVILKIALEYAVFLSLNREDRKRLSVNLAFPFSVVVKDIIIFIIYFIPFFSRSVEWNKRKIVIGRHTRIKVS